MHERDALPRRFHISSAAFQSVQLIANCTSHVHTRGTGPAASVSPQRIPSVCHLSQRRRTDSNTRGEYRAHLPLLLSLKRLKATVVILHLHLRAYTRGRFITPRPKATNSIDHLGGRIGCDTVENTIDRGCRTSVRYQRSGGRRVRQGGGVERQWRW